MKEKLSTKLFVLLISFGLVFLLVIAYGLDFRGWDSVKIYSCSIIGFWVFFFAPSIRGEYLKDKDKSFEENFQKGFRMGVSRICLPILIAPFYGIKYYFT